MAQFRHYKGKVYTHLTDATDVDNSDSEHGQIVVYVDEYGKVWSRLKYEFYGYVEVPAPDGVAMVRRFAEIRCDVCGEWLDECRAGHQQTAKHA